MKKRTAGVLTTVVVLSLGSYGAWCARTFYMVPPGIDPTDMPPEVVAATPSLAEAAGMMGNEEFGVERLFHYLSHPYAERPKLGISAVRSSEDMIIVSPNTPVIIGCCGVYSPLGTVPSATEIYFIRKSGKWEHAPAEEGLLHE